MKKLVADMVNGLQEVKDFEDYRKEGGNLEVVGNQDFFRYLIGEDFSEDFEAVGCEVSDELYNELYEEYGIKEF